LGLVVILVDIRHKADPKDMMMLEMLRQTGQSFLIVATKADKIAKTKRDKAIRNIASGLQLPASYILPFSATKKIGLSNLLTILEKYLFDTRIEL
jgi:GTP-binding protein